MNAVSIPGSEEFDVLSPSCIEIVQETLQTKLTGVISGERGGHAVGKRRLITRASALLAIALHDDKCEEVRHPA
ncbi:hypothetical protein AVEN_232389-1 [Araneus ventricosus]|uniref:Uncharacterized protein n=1 Tax=Araneus ventricosus TaxID=182803 RepID=A0A4Y2CTZ6_ARAVE|nr:hypothetical protein AVEN_232389-1 [Araneus ventricosus]